MDDKGDAKTGFTGQESWNMVSYPSLGLKDWPENTFTGPSPEAPGCENSHHSLHGDTLCGRAPFPPLPEDSSWNVSFHPCVALSLPESYWENSCHPEKEVQPYLEKLFRKGLGCRIFFFYLRYFDLLNLCFSKWHCKSRGSSQFNVSLKICSVLHNAEVLRA